MSKWTITKSGGRKLDAIETTVRKYPQSAEVGNWVDLVLKDTATGTPVKCDEGRFDVYAVLWRDAFDEQTGRALYVLVSSQASKREHDKADALIEEWTKKGAHEAGETFGAVVAAEPAAEEPTTALVKVEKVGKAAADEEPPKLKQGTLPGMPEPDRRGELRAEIDEKRKTADAAKKEMKEAAEALSEYLADHLVGDRPAFERGTLETFVMNYRDARTKFVMATIAAGNAAKELDAEERRIRKENQA